MAPVLSRNFWHRLALEPLCPAAATVQYHCMGDYRRLTVWQKARLLRRSIYRLTESFPPEERYGLKAQLRGACVSVMSNLAEGCGRNRDGELRRFVSIALGSVSELQSQLVAATDEGYLEAAAATQVRRQAEEVRRMLAGLANRLRRDEES
ncbi:MAG: four helix bundle protein [Gemmatimonadales bacterium]